MNVLLKGAIAGFCFFALAGVANAVPIDFKTYVQDNGEQAAPTPMSFLGGVDVTATASNAGGTGSPVAYLDTDPGLGVCQVLDGAGFCDPADDDNVNTSVHGAEVLSVAFNVAGAVVGDIILRAEGHAFAFAASAVSVLISIGDPIVLANYVTYWIESGTGHLFTTSALSTPASAFALGAAGTKLNFKFDPDGTGDQFYLSKLDISNRPGNAVVVPLPAALPLLLGALGGLAFLGRIRGRRQNA